MARRPRNDEPGSWHHVMNRGIARRTLFESQRDIRTFLARLAESAHEGQIEVHAFSVLTTHFHLLLRSPTGDLSAAMQAIQNQYARWFNRSRDRDGPLHRGRFRSKRVTTIGYRRQLVRYIDANPVEADIVETAALYSHGSAARYAQAEGPRWLMRDWIESCVLAATNATSYQPRDYTKVFGGPISSRLVRLIEKRLAMPGQVEDPLDDLLHAAPEHVVEWMRARAALADGTNIGLPVCDVDDLADVIDEARRRQGAWTMSFAGGSTDVWEQLHIALLREICGTTWREAGMRLRLSTAAAWRAYQRHARALVEDREYGLRAAGIVATALERTSPPPSVRVKQSALARVCQPD